MTAKTFDLSNPFEHRGTTYETISLRRPKVRDLRMFLKNLDKDATSAMEKAIANLAEIDDAVIAEMDLEDFTPIKKWFEDFLKPMLSDSDES